MKSVSKTRARKVANRILRENRKGRSFRAIAREDYQGVAAGTLNRFANSKGEWLPKNIEILSALGLLRRSAKPAPAPSPGWWKRVEKQAIRVMAEQTSDAVIRRRDR